MAKLGEVCVQITDGSHNPPSGVEQSEYLMLSSKNIKECKNQDVAIFSANGVVVEAICRDRVHNVEQQEEWQIAKCDQHFISAEGFERNDIHPIINLEEIVCCKNKAERNNDHDNSEGNGLPQLLQIQIKTRSSSTPTVFFSISTVKNSRAEYCKDAAKSSPCTDRQGAGLHKEVCCL